MRFNNKPAHGEAILDPTNPWTSKMLGCWLMNTSGVLEDLSGNGLRGKRNDTPRLTGHSTKYSSGQVLDFDGSNDYYDLGTGTPVQGDRATMIIGAVWDTPTSDDYRIFSKAAGGFESQHVVMLGSAAGTFGVARCRVLINGTVRTVLFNTSSGSEALVAGEFAQISFIYDGSDLYLQQINPTNGHLEINYGGVTGNIGTSSDTIAIGRNGSASSNYFNGKIHYIYLFDDAPANRQQFLQSVYKNPYQFFVDPFSTSFLVPASGTTFFQTNTGSITPAGALSTAVTFGQSVSGSITTTGAITKKTQKSLSGSITPTGSLVKKTLKALSGSITATGSLVKKTFKTFTGSITSSGVLAAAYMAKQAVSGSITGTGALATFKFTPSPTTVGRWFIRQGGKILGMVGLGRSPYNSRQR